MGASTEGLFSKLFGKKKPETKKEEFIIDWYRANIVDDKLRAGLTIRPTMVTINDGFGKWLCRAGRPITGISNLLSAVQGDTRHYKSLWDKQTRVSKKAWDVQTRFNAVLYRMSDAPYEKVMETVLSFKGKLPTTVVDVASGDRTKLLGNKDGVSGEPQVTRQSFEVSGTLDDVNALLKFAINELWTEFDTFEVPQGYDFTDPPFRGYVDELQKDPRFDEIMSVLNAHLEPTFSETYNEGIEHISGSTDTLFWSLLELIRKMAVEAK